MIDYRVLPLNTAVKYFSLDALTEAFEKFSCKVDTDLENFLRFKAMEYEVHEKGKTFLLVERSALEARRLEVVAYFTLANTAIDLSGFGEQKKKKVVGDFPNRSRRDAFPAFLIGQLGRDDRYSHDDISGEAILEESYRCLKKAATILGGKLVVLECREHMFDKVYSKLGFRKLVNELSAENLYMLYNRVEFDNY